MPREDDLTPLFLEDIETRIDDVIDRALALEHAREQGVNTFLLNTDFRVARRLLSTAIKQAIAYRGGDNEPTTV